MKIIVLENESAVAQFGAEQIIRQVTSNPKSVLGLATGSSPIALYRLLIEANKQNSVSFRDAITFNLDEYLGLEENHPQSYRHFMNTQLFDHIDIADKNTHVPNGSTKDPLKSCTEFEYAIKEAGGIDLQLLGIGQNGHIGFNEPSSSLASRTRVKTLTQNTISANQRFFAEDEFQPHLAITMGIGTIMEAKSILLIACGEAKAKAIAQTVEGAISARWPSSILQMHPNATLVIDKAAASLLEDLTFYQHIERENLALQTSTAV